MARKMASCGANLVLTDVGAPPIENAPVAYGSMENLVAISKDLENEFRVKVLALEMDVTQTDSINKAISAVDAEFGRLNFLFNNAGAAIGVPPDDPFIR